MLTSAALATAGSGGGGLRHHRRPLKDLMVMKFDKIEKAAVTTRSMAGTLTPMGRTAGDSVWGLLLPPSVGFDPCYGEEGLATQVLQMQPREEESRLSRIRGLPPSAVRQLLCSHLVDESHDTLCALALSTVFQEAADAGAEAFANVVSEHGPPAVLAAGGETSGSDVSAYGLTVGPSPQPHYACDGGVLHELQAVEDTIDALGERVPTGGAVALAAAVPDPAIPALHRAQLRHLPRPQLGGGARPIMATSHTDSEFPGTVSALHAAFAGGDDLGYHADDWSDSRFRDWRGLQQEDHRLRQKNAPRVRSDGFIPSVYWVLCLSLLAGVASADRVPLATLLFCAAGDMGVAGDTPQLRSHAPPQIIPWTPPPACIEWHECIPPGLDTVGFNYSYYDLRPDVPPSAGTSLSGCAVVYDDPPHDMGEAPNYGS
ncbi:hypothetical protein CYMTET_34601 [Cymbomonas tetramitiformis]|uniref:Uncharacterized protein n=1 Tax=Cymbomonas tetramitiformis TaxID=36881 RepID=A0AAE0FAM9_9CHLO|nr:hypothetical protein CYMTET_34601 [Cymbomonas tetramitiformis]